MVASTADHLLAVRRVATVMLVVAATLAVASAIHLSGLDHGSAPFNPSHAGIAEMLIGVALAGGAYALWVDPVGSRAIGLSTLGFAIIGFVVGLRMTTGGGHVPDVAYHLVVL